MGEQGIAVFHQRRMHQFVAVHAEQSQKPLFRAFELARGGGQNIGNVFGKLPRLHEILSL